MNRIQVAFWCCYPSVFQRLASININWELIRNRDLLVPLDLPNQNLHFHKISKDSNMH